APPTSMAQPCRYPANCRLLDPGEAATAGAGDGTAAVLLLAFESADHALDAWMARALALAAEHGGAVPPGAGQTKRTEAGAREGAAGAWRKTFLDAPYLRDTLVAMGMVSETFETAITWDRFAAFDEGVRAAAEEALRRVCWAGQLTRRFTPVYPDGPAPYYTVLAPGRRRAELRQRA